MIYPLVREMAAAGAPIRVPVVVACRVLGFSPQAYYQWLKQPRILLVRKKKPTSSECCGNITRGRPRGWLPVFWLTICMLSGMRLSERRVWRLCKVADIQSVIAKRKRRYQRAGAPVGDDLVERDFTADGLDENMVGRYHQALDLRGLSYMCAFKECARQDRGVRD